ncbi:DEKNAAC103136 [Brettanomyces naardenensis]|uniref:DEKNAAC103136 n=1 Tax=Brettanomyces naardenensis TaxID=13370 RepID=A0A448YMH5_BRENA|nr:DEKNAAC103136 [Brettanomyces naardenensis]
MSLATRGYFDDSIHFSKEEDTVEDGVRTISKANLKQLKYPRWAPTWDSKQELAFSNPKPYTHTDRGYFADPSFDSLFKGTGATKTRVTPKLGLVVEGLQLSKLTDKQKDDLALLIEQNGVVAFRKQDFKHLSFDDLKKWGRYYGPLHIHPTSGAPRGEYEFHLTFRRGDPGEQERLLARRLNNISYHSDVSYENQPPGLTFLTMLQTGAGGDTQFVDMIEAYERLSPTVQNFIDKLQVLHTSKLQADNSKREGGITRKVAIDSIHPLVRYHPVLKKKALFLNSSFTTRVLGLKDEESDFLLNFLISHTETLLDAHIRPSWDEDTVVAWDNRRLIHTATLDWESNEIRTSFRLTPLAERPIRSEKEFNAWTPEKEEENIKKTEELLALTPAEYYEKFYKNYQY